MTHPLSRRILFITIVFAVTLAGAIGCESEGPGSPNGSMKAAKAPAAERVTDPAIIAKGREVYKANCAGCHGGNAEGAPNWRQPGPDGHYPPPPLNGTAHAWHHPTDVLIDVIKQGSEPGMGNMPAWDGKLTDEEIRAVVAWFQSLWSDQVYAAWQEMQSRRRQ